MKKMGKKKHLVDYDTKALKNLAIHIEKARQPMKGEGIPKLKINLGELEDTLKTLPKKEREVMEHFWGLIPGTPIRAMNALNRIGKDQALSNMLHGAYKVIEKIISIEFLYLYDTNVKKLIANFMTKIDKSGYEKISDIDAIKYFIIFLVFFAGGHQMVYETEGIQVMTEEEEKTGYFDQYALLRATWESTAKDLPNHSIRLRLIIQAIEMFDLKDVITMKKYVGLQIEKEYQDVETEDVGTFWKIRIFKEKIFQYGSWDITAMLIYGNKINQEKLLSFCKHFGEFRSDWKTIKRFQKGEVIIATTKGEVKLLQYDIEGLEFTDVYEVMFLYLIRNYIQ